jgi:hypothetical protein
VIATLEAEKVMNVDRFDLAWLEGMAGRNDDMKRRREDPGIEARD